MHIKVLTILLFISYSFAAPLSSFFDVYQLADRYLLSIEDKELAGEFGEDESQETEESKVEKEKSNEIFFPHKTIFFFLEHTNQLRWIKSLKTLSTFLGKDYPPPKYS